MAPEHQSRLSLKGLAVEFAQRLTVPLLLVGNAFMGGTLGFFIIGSGR